MFVPFTGLDHHKNCVTFGAGLIFKEDKESYIWLLENFKKAMGHEPKIIVTDQDGSMKHAIDLVFPHSLHRLCMWHITQKVPGKLKYDMTVGDDFRSNFNKIVWSNDLEPSEFESKWLELFNDYKVSNRRWFDDMYAIRHYWIPAYFRDAMFGGLLRTTSISESMNSFFGKFTDKYYRLVELIMHYESGLESQRHTQAKLNHDCATKVPKLKTPLKLELHASKQYTISVFNEVQKHIYAACFSCNIVGMTQVSGITTYSVQEDDQNVAKVTHRHMEQEVICSCRMFQRKGMPCCHMFLVFKNLGMDEIPSKYVLLRWTNAATITPTFSIDDTVVQQCASLEEMDTMRSELISDFYSCLGHLEGNTEALKDFSLLIKEHKNKLSSCSVDNDSGCRVSLLRNAEALAGASIATEVSIFPPDQAKNKGSGKRIMSSKEISIAASLHPKRRCGKCKKLATHNSRIEIILLNYEFIHFVRI